MAVSPAAPAGVAGRARPALSEGLSARARSAVVTTPGKLRLFSIVLVVVTLLVMLIDLTVVSHRRSGVTAVADQSGLVVLAQRVQTELTDADAGAANAFLAGGLEPADQVARYVNGTTGAADDLSSGSAAAGANGPDAAALRSMAERLTTYTGLVATAQADNRQGFPVGAAYLRSASTLLHGTLLPQASVLAETSAGGTNHAEDRATAATDVALAVVATLALLALLVAVQLWITRRAKRAVNVGLAIATLLTLVLGVVVLGDLGSERSDVVRGGEHGYASVARVTAARALAYQAQGDESDALIARGNGQSYESDLDTAAARVKVLISQAAATADAADLSGLEPAFDRWLAVDTQIRTLDGGGQHDQAVALALGHAAGDSLGAFTQFDAQIGDALSAEQQSFTHQTSEARKALDPLRWVVPAGAILIIVAVLGGIQPRVNEYR
jgi:hypothetical protein